MKKVILLILSIFTLFAVTGIKQVNADELLRPSNLIYDPENYLSEGEFTKSQVEASLKEFNSSNKDGYEVGIYIVKSLGGSSIESKANEVAKHWELGQNKGNKGVLIALSIEDRKSRIEISNNANAKLTDSLAVNILSDSELKSKLRAENYNGAVLFTLSSIEKIVQEDIQKENNSRSKDFLSSIFGLQFEENKKERTWKTIQSGVIDSLFHFGILVLPLIFIVSMGGRLIRKGFERSDNYPGRLNNSQGLNLNKSSSDLSSDDSLLTSAIYYSSSSSSSSNSLSSSSFDSGGDFDGGGASGGW